MLTQKFVSKMKNVLSRVVFPFMGLASLIWFVVRVIPKPSRASYPCMKVAFPIASSFIVWLIAFVSSVTAFKLAKVRFQQARYLIGALFLVVGISAGLYVVNKASQPSIAKIQYETDFPANQPMGVAQGIFPGRVVWAWNPDATNENQTGTDDGKQPVSNNDDYYFLAKNNNQDVVDSMLVDVVLNLTGEETVADAWDALFKFHNNKKTGEASSYKSDEIIFIKTNATSIIQGSGGNAWSMWDPTDLTMWRPNWMDHLEIVETTPQVVLSVLRHLVNEAGVPEENIYVGDPMKNAYKHVYDYWKAEFPNVNVLGNDRFYNGLDLEAIGRVPVVPTEEAVIFYSDRGTVMNTAPAGKDSLYTIHEDASYLINIPALKAHACAGITLCAKNHFGSQASQNAQHLHKGLVCQENDVPVRTDYGVYRVQVDLMAHELLGGNTMLFLVDGLYACIEGWTDAYPDRWDMAPFNGDFTNSLIASLDPVAVEAVCFDLLRTEYNGNTVETKRPNMSGVSDYLQQAADPANWPEDIEYDPENDGTVIGSLGVFEHWNNATDMQYSRDLGTGEGIELIKAFAITSPVEKSNSFNAYHFQLNDNYPNPFNNGTMISYTLETPSQVSLEIFDVTGKKVRSLVNENQSAGSHLVNWNGTDQNSNSVASGMYVYRLTVENKGKTMISESKRMLMVK